MLGEGASQSQLQTMGLLHSVRQDFFRKIHHKTAMSWCGHVLRGWTDLAWRRRRGFAKFSLREALSHFAVLHQVSH